MAKSSDKFGRFVAAGQELPPRRRDSRGRWLPTPLPALNKSRKAAGLPPVKRRRAAPAKTLPPAKRTTLRRVMDGGESIQDRRNGFPGAPAVAAFVQAEGARTGAFIYVRLRVKPPGQPSRWTSTPLLDPLAFSQSEIADMIGRLINSYGGEKVTQWEIGYRKERGQTFGPRKS